MKEIKENIKVTILIVNFNNSKYISRCIKSMLAQSHKNLDIIFIDDQSTDNSIKIAKTFKNIKIIKTKNKSRYGCYNQINAYRIGFKYAKGDYIFFCDSDDFFKKEKITTYLKFFSKKKISNICFDKPISLEKNKKKKIKIYPRSKFLIPWPKIPPQSCIVIKKIYFKKIIKKISINRFNSIWFDFRLVNQAIIDFNEITVLPYYLTYYQQHESSISIGYKKYSSNWWKRRYEAHKFLKYLYKKNNKKLNFSADKILTSLINKFIKW